MTPGNTPNEGTVKFCFGHLRISILIQGRLNIERGEYTNDDEVHRPEGEVSARADPSKFKCNYSPFAEGREYRRLLPSPRSEHPILRIED